MRANYSRKAFYCRAIALALSACLPIRAMLPAPASRTKALQPWKRLITMILARGEGPIICTEVASRPQTNLEMIIKNMEPPAWLLISEEPWMN